jgi:hypothetical protein
MLKANLKLTIAEALSQGRFWECKMKGCHRPFQSQKALGHHFSQAHAAHAAHTREGWRAEANHMYKTWKILAQEDGDEDIQFEARRRREEVQEEDGSLNEQVPLQHDPPPVRRNEPSARARTRERERRDHSLRVSSSAFREREEARRQEEEKRTGPV